MEQSFISKTEFAQEVKLSWKGIKRKLGTEIETLIGLGYKKKSKLLNPAIAAKIRELLKGDGVQSQT